MFKVLKDGKIIGVSNKEPTLLGNYEVYEDLEHVAEDYVHIDGKFVLNTSAEAKEDRKEKIRLIRDKMLSNFEWRISRNDDERELEITETDNRQDLLKYRQYLRDYTKKRCWYNSEPLEFSKWQEQLNK